MTYYMFEYENEISYTFHACEDNREMKMNINASCFDGSLKIILMQTLSFECGQV